MHHRPAIHLLIPLLLAVALSACDRLSERWPRAVGGPGDLVECGHDADSVSSPVIDAIRDVPEFHDCQRFIVHEGSARLYDSLHAIYAASYLDTLTAMLGRPLTEPPESTSQGREPKTIRTRTGTVVITDRLVVDHRVATVAVILSGGRYGALGMEPGLNCLYIGRYIEGDTLPEQWFARMEPQGNVTSASCDKSSVRELGRGKDLQVTAETVDGFTADADYPAVARWDWDDVNHQQYIGIKCGAAWCEIGDTSFVASPHLDVDPRAPREVRRVRSIKGWYDQQFLAKEGRPGRLVPSRILGTIIAEPDVGSKTDADFAADYVTVARVILESNDPADAAALASYRTKFNFRGKAPDDPEAVLMIKSLPDTLWRARIHGPPSSPGPLFRRVRYRPAPTTFLDQGYRVPAVARWRWMLTDEGTWTRCPEGCCEMSSY
jgi:hypothetical protein